MATAFKNTIIKNIGTVPVELYTAQPGTNTTFVGLSLANLTDSVVRASVTLKDTTSVEGFIIKDCFIAPNSSLRVLNAGEKLIVAEQNSLFCTANINDSLDVVASFVEIT
mgnify:FL=1|tara:strand:- start:3037 stop:3366 length:330 start_codon:yes stop_codon:yes gene_type:complete